MGGDGKDEAMSANVIDSMVIAIGLEPSEIKAGIQQIEAHLQAALGIVTQFADGVDEGFREGAVAAGEVATAAKDAGDALQEAGDKGEKGLKKVAAEAQTATKHVNKLEAQARELGKSLGQKVKGFLTGVAAPVAGMIAAGAVVKGYFSDLATLDKLSRKTSLSMEERTAKQKLLAKYSKEDLERYRESNKALESLHNTLSRAFAPVMAAIVPALSWLARGLEKIVKYIAQHKSFFIPLIAGIAAIITAALLPALASGAAAALAMFAPFLPFMAIVAGLALLIDDLWVYMNGGKSALADFWAIFGTGEEISEALASAWEDLKVIGTALWEGIKAAAGTFFSYFSGAVEPLVNIFKNVLRTIKAIFTGNFDEAIEHFKNLLGSLGEFIVAMFTGWFNLVYDVVTNIFSAIGEYFSGIFDSILGSITGAIKGILSNIPDMLLPDSLVQWANSVDTTVKDSAANLPGVSDDAGAVAAADGVSPAATNGPVDNHSETTVDVGGITVNTQSTDASGVGNEVGNAVRKLANTGNNSNGY
jgi:hypothetical protein